MGVARSRDTPIVAAAFAVIIVAWGMNYLFVRVGLGLAAPLWLAFLRSGVGALGALGVWLALGRPGLQRREHATAAVLGLLNTSLFFGLWFLAARFDRSRARRPSWSTPSPCGSPSSPSRLLQFRLRFVTWAAILHGFGGIVLISRALGPGGRSPPAGARSLSSWSARCRGRSAPC